MRKTILSLVFVLGIVGLVFAGTDVEIVPGKTIVSGVKTITVPNVPVVIASDTAVLNVTLTWSSLSADATVTVGSSTMATTGGISLTSGSVVTLNVDNLDDIYVSASKANGRVAYIAVVR